MAVRILQNTIAVLVVTTLTAAGVYGGVSALRGSGIALSARATASSDEALICPATGCSAVSCHATSSGGTAATDSDAASLQTCPRTGCTSQGCHATDGGSAGFGGHGYGFGGRDGADSEPEEWPTT